METHGTEQKCPVIIDAGHFEEEQGKPATLLKQGFKTRIWGGTIFGDMNKYHDLLKLEPSEHKATYVCWQKELCPDTERPHIHFCIAFENPRCWKPISKRYGGCWMCRPFKLQNYINYCMKEESRMEGPWELGERPMQGSRTDGEEVKEMILGGAKVRDIAINAPDYYIRYHKGVEKLYNLIKCEDRVPGQLVCKWFWGKSGVGKTRAATRDAIEIAGERPYIKDSSKWWDMYNGEKVVIIDDYNPSGGLDFRTFLRLTDKWQPFMGEYKGGYTKVSATVIYLTCEHPPSEFWFDNELIQVERRFDEISEIL